MKSESGFTTAALGLVVFVLIIGFIVFQRTFVLNQNSSDPSPSPTSSVNPSPSATTKPPVRVSPTPTTPAFVPSPTASPAPNNSGSSDVADVIVTTSCSDDHDNLGKHLDGTISFKNLDKLNAKDLIVSVIDTTTQNRSESHVTVEIVNNITIPVHKYAYAINGSRIPLELVPDGREYAVRIMKATYKADGTIDVYVQAFEKRFSKKCFF